MAGSQGNRLTRGLETQVRETSLFVPSHFALSSNGLRDEFPNGLSRPGSCGPSHFSPVKKDHHRRYRTNLETTPQRRQIFSVDLDDQEATGLSGSYFFHFRRHHSTRTTPGRPEVDQDRHRGIRNEGFEVRLSINFYWTRHGRERGFTFAAAAAPTYVREGRAILLPASRTNRQDSFVINGYRCHRLKTCSTGSSDRRSHWLPARETHRRVC